MALSSDVIEERLANIQIQVNRLVAHFESEQRNSVNHGKSIDRLEKWLDRVEKANDKHEKILFNGGEGIIRRVDHIIHAEEVKLANEKENAKKFHWTFANIISIMSLVSSIVFGWLLLKH